MRSTWNHPITAVARNELSRLFASPLAFALIAAFYLAMGLLFLVLLEGLREQAAELSSQALEGGIPPPAVDLPGALLEALTRALANLFLFLAPLLAMGFFAHEGRAGTLELLLASPLTPAHLVAGKFLAGWLVLVLLLAPVTALCLLVAAFSSPPLPWTTPLLACAGLLLLSTAMLSLAFFPASLTDSRLVAAVLAFILLTALWLSASLPLLQDGPLGALLRFVSLSRHYDDLARGVLDTRHLVYYFSLCGLGLTLSALGLSSRRWRS